VKPRGRGDGLGNDISFLLSTTFLTSSLFHRSRRYCDKLANDFSTHQCTKCAFCLCARSFHHSNYVFQGTFVRRIEIGRSHVSFRNAMVKQASKSRYSRSDLAQATFTKPILGLGTLHTPIVHPVFTSSKKTINVFFPGAGCDVGPTPFIHSQR